MPDPRRGFSLTVKQNRVYSFRMQHAKLTSKLNLLVPIEREGAPPLMAYVAPLGREAYDHYVSLLAAAFEKTITAGGPWLAIKTMASVIRQIEKNRPDLGMGFLAELDRLTTVVVPGETGMQAVPVKTALQLGHIDEDDVDGLESVAAFFTVTYALFRKGSEWLTFKDMLSNVSKAYFTPSDITEAIASWPTLTKDAALT